MYASIRPSATKWGMNQVNPYSIAKISVPATVARIRLRPPSGTTK